MKRLNLFFLTVCLFAGLFAFLYVGPAQSATLTFDLDFEFSGATAPAGTAPWITATFDDSFGDLNTVRLTMSANNLVDAEFIDDWLFNFDPDLDPTLLTFNFISGSAGAANAVNTGVDAFQADGDGKFDIHFDFPPPPGEFDAKFSAGETSVYDITYIAPIYVSAFDFGSAPGGGAGTFNSAAHIQGIGLSDDDSGWIGPINGAPVPEPATMVLLGSGLLGFAGIGRKKFFKK